MRCSLNLTGLSCIWHTLLTLQVDFQVSRQEVCIIFIGFLSEENVLIQNLAAPDY